MINPSCKLICLTAAIMFLTTTSAWSQCATGVNTGGGNCIPPDASGMPDYNANQSEAPAQPQPQWQLTWGAIVIDSKTGGAGTVTGRGSKVEAIRDATRDCESRGASGCKVELTYQNQCAAIAWGTGGRGLAHGPDLSKTEGDAMTACNESGAQECKLVYSACSAPIRVR